MAKETYYKDKQSGRIMTKAEMLDSVDDDDQLDSFYLVDVEDSDSPKVIYCTVVEGDRLDSALVYHTKTDHYQKANERAREELIALGWDPKEFEIFSFELNKNDIIEK